MAKYKVIDVSSWQGKIDWKKVKAAGVVGAIIRYADGTTLDSRFKENMANAKANGIHIGSYIFSRAKTKAEAEKEAERLFNACKPYSPDMPLYIDLEVAANSKYANTVAQAFLNKMAELGGRGGVYANLNWWNNYLADTARKYSASPFWIAQYYTKITHKNPKLFGMWQYSSSSSVNGIKGRVDMDECYIAYWDQAVDVDYDVIPAVPETEITVEPAKTVDELAQEVLDGKWGIGDERKKRLTEAGYDYAAVQKRVNELLEEKKRYHGTLPTMKLVKTNAEVIADAIKFAKWIVSDNRFGYGRKGGAKFKGTKEYSITHSGGCHFCGSNAHKINEAKKAKLKNPEEWEFTFVCNTFVHACYAHAGVMPMLNARGHAWWHKNYQASKNWADIKKPAKISDLKPGDVLGWDTHFCLYLGNGKGAEATSNGDASASKEKWNTSIRIGSFANHFKKATHVYRYIGTVNSTALIKYGEVSARVALLQKFLNWYGDYKLAEDGLFGDGTLSAVKKFQKEQGLTVDGIVGSNTIAKMKEAKK